MNGAEVLLYDTSSAQGVLQQTFQHGSDPVHGTIVLGPLCSLATSTAPVFRLRKLTQLGPTCFGPYPAVEHTRFPHCLGVAHLARRCVQHLAETGADDVSPLDIELTSLAGLCHDLGHGPFSHSFETILERVLGHGHKWRHEQMSCQLLEFVVQEAGLDLATHELQHLQDMIDNGLRQPQPQPWPMQVISNKVSGLDMDKIDYEIRDVLMAGMQLEQDCRQLIPLVTQHCKVLAGHICFDQQWQQQVAQVFDLRTALHKRMYQHQQAKAAEAMVTDAFVLADQQLGISDKIHDPEEFLTLDDSLVDAIQRAARCKGADANMVQAAGILKRLHRRDTMYQLAGEAELPAHAEQHGSRLTADKVVRYQTLTSPVTLKQEDLRLQHFSISHGLGAEDPLERIFLYDEHDNITKKAADGISRPKSFLTKMVRVYVAKLCSSPQEQQACVDAAHTAFSRAVQEEYGPHAKLLDSSSSGGGSNSSSAIKSAATAAVELRSAAAALLQQGQDLQAHRAAGIGSHHCSQGGDSSSSNSKALAWPSGRASVAEAPSGDVRSMYGNGVVECWHDATYQC